MTLKDFFSSLIMVALKPAWPAIFKTPLTLKDIIPGI